MRYLTTQQIADMYGVHPSRIGRIARSRGIKPTATVGRSHLWTRRQADKLAPGPHGVRYAVQQRRADHGPA